MKRLTFTCITIGAVAMAGALSTFSSTFHTKYGVKKGSALDKAACSVCHTSAKGGKLNAYGKDVQAAMKAAKTKKLTPAVLTKVEGLDSNKNGKSNGEDIKADKNPGA